MDRLKEIKVNDIYENPKSFGMPTFEEFKKNPERWTGRTDASLAEVSEGGLEVKSKYRKQTYEIEGYRCKTLEEVERIALSQGIKLKELDYRPQMIPQGGGQWDILIKFVSKHERKRRENIRG
jgi:hypothetical protein